MHSPPHEHSFTNQTDYVDCGDAVFHLFYLQGAFSVMIWAMSGLVKGSPGAAEGVDEYYLDNRVEVNKQHFETFVKCNTFIPECRYVHVLGVNGSFLHRQRRPLRTLSKIPAPSSSYIFYIRIC